MQHRYHQPWSGYTLAVIVLYSVPAFTANNTNFNGNDFSNNLLSDLAPLIALFGEQVTKQYLSQSMHWLEHIIFACAPLGMITAITCAIRVAGGKTLRAIIGRAREPGAQAEIEVMSSTSPDVCELWNGVGIVRVAGSPDIIEVIYDRAGAGVVEDAHQSTEQQCGVYERKHVLVSCGSSHNFWSRGANHERLQGTDDGQELDLLLGNPDESGAPNISLNTTNSCVSKWELWMIAVIGVVLQAGVLVFDGVMLNYSHWEWRKDGSKVPEYAFPLTLVGTLAVVGGMFTCANVIELSTVECVWKTKPEDKRDLQILWLQRGQTVNDQKFKSYAICAARNQRTVTTSRPTESKENRYHFFTTIGTAISVVGFILQFVGLRAMHYSATLAQLVAMIIMTMLRVLLRRNLTAKPKSFRVEETPPPDERSHYVQELPEDYELDSVAKQMTGCSSWKVVVTRDHSVHPEDPSTAVISRVLKTRIRLGHIAGLAWKGTLHNTVLSLSQTMEALMNHLWSPSGDGISPTGEMKSMTDFDWELPAEITTNSTGIGLANLKMTRSRTEDDFRPWKINQADIEAVFSLWMSYLSKNPNIGDEGDNLWVIGTARDRGHDVGRILCDWWISREIDHIDLGKIHETRNERKIHESRVLYCMEAPPTAETLQGIINTTSLTRMCAQFILSNFMIAAAKTIDQIKSETNFEPITGKRLLKVFNKDVHGLAEIFERFGLATLDDAYRIVVPALFEADTLPSLLDCFPEVLRTVENFGDTDQASAVYERIRNLCIYKASVLIDQEQFVQGRKVCMRLVKIFVRELGQEHQEVKKMRHSLRKFGQSLAKDLANPPRDEPEARANSTNAQTITYPLHHAIQASRVVDLYNTLSRNEHQNIEESKEGKTPLIMAVEQGAKDLVSVLLSFGADPAAHEIYEQTALHKATNVPRGEGIIKLLLSSGANVNDQQNPLRQTPLHLAAELGNESIVKLLVKKRTLLDLKDKLGRTAVSRAAGSGSLDVVKFLIEKGADPDIKDEFGRTAMHMAAEMGHGNIVQYLIQKGSDPTAKDKAGETALHTATSKGDLELVKFLLKSGADPDAKNNLGMMAIHKSAEIGHEGLVKLFLDIGSDIDAKDHGGSTVIHIAAGKGYDNLLQLLVEKGSDPSAKDKLGRTAMHYTARMGHQSVLQLLMDMGYDPDSKDNTGETAMQTAARNGHKTAVELLVQNGADPDAKDKLGKTAMHKASEAGEQSVVQLFLDNGSKPELTDDSGKTAIHMAAEKGHTFIVQLLTERGAILDAKTKSGRTALHGAAEMGHHTVVQLCLDNGSDLHVIDSEGKTALHMAASNGHKTILNLLKHNGADLQLKDLSGRSAMHRAAEMGYHECVKLLVGDDANLDSQDIHGDTAIHTAASNGHEAVVQLLIEDGIDPNVKNKLGRTPLHQAVEGGYGVIVKILIQGGADFGARDNFGLTPVKIAEENGKGVVRKLLLGTRRAFDK